MCLKKIAEWFKPDPVIVPDPTGNKKTALLFAINNYPGTQNDLNGCLNDQRDMANMLNDKFPGFVIKKYSDSQVTKSKFINEIVSEIGKLVSGDNLLIHYSGHGTYTTDPHGDESDGYDEAVYLYDGMVIDDDIGNSLKNIPDGALVTIMLDSCFSGTATRVLRNSDHPTKNRFIVPLKTLPKKKLKKRIRFPKEEMKWVVLSGCGESQTSADAYINGEYHGAFTYFALKTLKVGITYNEWIKAIEGYLPSQEYDQIPTLEGKESLFSKQVFT